MQLTPEMTPELALLISETLLCTANCAEWCEEPWGMLSRLLERIEQKHSKLSAGAAREDQVISMAAEQLICP